jgi:hypothetical protein
MWHRKCPSADRSADKAEMQEFRTRPSQTSVLFLVFNSIGVETVDNHFRSSPQLTLNVSVSGRPSRSGKYC